MTIGIIADRSENLKETLNAYIKHIDIELKDLVVSEITINSIENLLCPNFKESMKVLLLPNHTDIPYIICFR